MRHRIVLLIAGVVLVSVGCCLDSRGGDDDLPTPSGLKFPMANVAVTSDVKAIVDVLPAETWYVIESQTEKFIVAVPEGLVQIEGETGPIKAYGRFSGQTPDRVQKKTFAAPYVYFVTAVAKGQCELVIFPHGVQNESEIVRQRLNVMGPRPPPDPVDPDEPEPPPDPVVKSFRVIFVKESGATLSPEQTAIPAAKVIRDYLVAKTTKDEGISGWREYDPQINVANEQTTMKELWAAVKPKIQDIPCLVIEVNGHATVMPFPETVEEAMETLKKYGGD